MNRLWSPVLGGALFLLLALPALANDVKRPTYEKRGAFAPTTGPRALADVAELEPNDRPAQAQPLACGDALAPAALTNLSAVPDSDWVVITASEGDLLTLETGPATPPSPFVDTILNLFAADGTTHLVSNDDSGVDFFAKITDFPAPYTGVYYGRVRGFDGSEGGYRLDLTCTPAPPPPVNDRCEDAIALGYGAYTLSGTTHTASNDYDLCPGVEECPASCTGFNSPGRDAVYRLDIGSAGDVIDLTYALAPASADASIYIVTDCADVQASCVAGQDTGEGAPTEHLSHAFAAPGTYYLILDAFTSAGGDWTLDVCLNCPTTTRPVTWGALKVRYR
jgi:hypothetical protein